MPRKRGRPPKETTVAAEESKQLILDAAVRIIKKKGAGALSVHSVCEEADVSNGTFYYHFKNKDDLLMSFLRETSFDGFELRTPLRQISRRVTELYLLLVERYMALGLDFMKSFYSTANRPLSAYMCEVNGKFEPGTVMARCERELQAAQDRGILSGETDIHALGRDICTIVKGCVFEWCLTEGGIDLPAVLFRIIDGYMKQFLSADQGE